MKKIAISLIALAALSTASLAMITAMTCAIQCLSRQICNAVERHSTGSNAVAVVNNDSAL